MENLEYYKKKKRPLNWDIVIYLLLWCLFISICLWCYLVSKCFFLVDTSLLANTSRTSFSYLDGSPGKLAVPPSAPVCSPARLKVSAETRDLRSSSEMCCITLGGSDVLQAGERWEMATVVAVTEVGYYNMLQGGLETYESISSQLFRNASPQRAGMKGVLVAVWDEAWSWYRPPCFSVGKSASWWRAVCVFTHLTRKDTPNRLSTLTCFYY